MFDNLYSDQSINFYIFLTQLSFLRLRWGGPFATQEETDWEMEKMKNW